MIFLAVGLPCFVCGINTKLIQQQINTMKKLLLVLAIGAFAACNDSATSTDSAVDSTAEVKVDSIQATGDSLTNVIDSTTEVKVDSVKAKADSAK
jgi:hypothetical protein